MCGRLADWHRLTFGDVESGYFLTSDRRRNAISNEHSQFYVVGDSHFEHKFEHKF